MWTELLGLLAAVAIVGLAAYVGVVAGRRTAPEATARRDGEKSVYLERENARLRGVVANLKESRDFWRHQSGEDRALILTLGADIRALARNNGARAIDDDLEDPPSVREADASVSAERRRVVQRARDVGLGRTMVDTVDRDTRPSPRADEREEDEEDDGN